MAFKLEWLEVSSVTRSDRRPPPTYPSVTGRLVNAGTPGGV